MKKIQRTFAVALLGLMGIAPPASGADCVSVPPGAISWWRAEGNGTDFIGTNHGTLTGPVTFTNGMVGQGFLLDGSTGGIDLGNVPAFDFAPDSNFSFEAWFNSFGPSGGGNDGLVIVSLNYNCSPTLQSLTIANSTPAFGVVSFSVRDANGVLGFVSSPPVSSNVFHHAVGVREVLGTNKTLRLYLDGTLIGTTNDPTTGELALNVSDWIGRRNWCGTYNVFNGIIDEVAIYNRALTSDEVTALFGAGAAGKCLCAPPSSGMVSWWRAEGNAQDSAGSNPGVLFNGASFSPGLVGQAFNFNAAANSGVLVASTPELNPVDAVSIEAWVKPSAYPNPGPTVLRKDQNQVGTTQYALMLGDGSVAGVVHFNIGGVAFVTGGSVPLNVWTHVAGTYDRQNLRVYVNGVEVANAAATMAIPTSTESLFLGREENFANRSFDGLIDEPSFYSRALTAAEIQTIFNAGNSGKCHARYAVDWFKVAGGGGVGSNATYRLMGTVGQADAGGPHTNSQFSLLGGFWALPVVVQAAGAPTLTIVPAAAGLATISWTPNTPGFVLQESLSLAPPNWTNSVSGPTNPVTVPAVLPTKFYRLNKP